MKKNYRTATHMVLMEMLNIRFRYFFYHIKVGKKIPVCLSRDFFVLIITFLVLIVSVAQQSALMDNHLNFSNFYGYCLLTF